MGARLGALTFAILAVVTAGGCQAIVHGDVPAFICTGISLAACPAGQFCRGTVCAPCEARDTCDGFDNDCNGEVDDTNERDVCDGIDNDCNGKVDDGPLSDKDGDGYTFCGSIDPQSGIPVNVDCNDEDKTIHPGAKETCNGRDDTCDGQVDDDACAPGSRCAPKRGLCVDDAAACPPEQCRSPKICDSETLECVTPNSAGPGEACTSNRACDTHICGDPATLSQTIVDRVGNVCTTPCCTSSECPPDQVCHATGASGSYCVPQRAFGTAPLGNTRGGAPCANGGECRSGICAEGICVDTCCSNDGCHAGSVCRLAPGEFRGKSAFTCQAPNPTGKPSLGDVENYCQTNADCKSGLCHEFEKNPSVRRCVDGCCGSGNSRGPSPCGKFSYSFYGLSTVVSQTLCRNRAVGPAGNVVSACTGRKGGSGARLTGAPCKDAADCASELCLTLADGSKGCTDVCCTDLDCASAGWVCRPTASAGNGFYLRCVPS